MTVESIMTRRVVTATKEESLLEIRDRFRKGGFHHLLVMDGDRLVGIISDRDVLRALSPFLDTLSEQHRDVQTLSRPASEIMRTDPITITPDTGVKDAIDLLLKHGISCLPVVSPEGAIEGIVTSKDMLKHAVRQDG